MAAIQAKVITGNNDPVWRSRRAIWSNITENDNAVHIDLEAQINRSVHVYGEFGEGSVKIEGSNEPSSPVNWVTLHAQDGSELVFSEMGLKQISEIVRWIRPSVVDGIDASITVSIEAR